MLPKTEQQLAISAAFVAIVACITWFFVSHTDFSTEPSLGGPVAAPVEPEHIDLCGQVVRGSCEMLIKEKTSECVRAKVEPRILARLVDPAQDEACQKAQIKLSEGCPANCVFDYGTLVSVPGKAQFDFFPESDEPGKCFVRARRLITMQGKCAEREIPAPPVAEPTPAG